MVDSLTTPISEAGHLARARDEKLMSAVLCWRPDQIRCK